MENSDSKVSGLWNGEDEPYKALRMPNTITPVFSESNKVNGSNLRADAAEWYPGTHFRTNSNAKTNKKIGGMAQQRINKIKFPTEPEYVATNDVLTSDIVDVDYDFDTFCMLIANIIVDPGKFDESVDMFNDLLLNHTENDEIITNIAKYIFDTGIDEHNFRYNGARLCLVIARQFPSFKKLLIKIANESLQFSIEPGLALFLGELFLQFDYNIEIGNNLIIALNKLIDNGDDESLKTVCQTLKLSGSSLEDLDETSTTFILGRLKEKKNSVTENLQILINKVWDLKLSKWGQSTSELTNSEVKTGDCGEISKTEIPTFYGPDGNELTTEEEEFLVKNCGVDFDEYDSDPETSDDPEMDEEIQAAFEKFVQENN